VALPGFAGTIAAAYPQRTEMTRRSRDVLVGAAAAVVLSVVAVLGLHAVARLLP
jgi:hypothetical protein